MPYMAPKAPEGAPNVLTTGKHTLGMEFFKESTGEYGESHGTAKFSIDEETVAGGPICTQSGMFALCGDGLRVGRDSSDPVSKEYGAVIAFEGGMSQGVAVSVGSDIYLNREKQAAAAMARD